MNSTFLNLKTKHFPKSDKTKNSQLSAYTNKESAAFNPFDCVLIFRNALMDKFPPR
jgi:hypothetical protein